MKLKSIISFFLNIYLIHSLSKSTYNFNIRSIILSYDTKHKDSKEIYECLGFIAKKIRYRAEDE